VEAISVLLAALPASLRPPVFVVLHLPRQRPSLLVEVLGHASTAPVVEAEDKMAVEPGTVYVAPPDYHLLVEPGPTLALSVDEPVNYSRPSIDVLFESAADVFGDGLLGIILTGGSRDGASGLRAIRAAGGTTVVQEPQDARVPFMTEAAIRESTVDFVLPVDGIAALLRTLDHA
jgi:two-component system chemotaxis response regulator CheB